MTLFSLRVDVPFSEGDKFRAFCSDCPDILYYRKTFVSYEHQEINYEVQCGSDPETMKALIDEFTSW